MRLTYEEAKVLFPDIINIVDSATNQFARDLLLTGAAAMPDGRVVVLTPVPTNTAMLDAWESMVIGKEDNHG